MIIFIFLSISLTQLWLVESIGESIDAKISTIDSVLMGEEKELQTRMESIAPMILEFKRISVVNDNQIQSLTKPLDDLYCKVLYDSLSSLKNYQNNSIETSCETLNTKNDEIEGKVENLEDIEEKILTNSSKLAELNSLIAYLTLVEYGNLLEDFDNTKLPQLKAINSIINAVSNVNLEFLNYLIIFNVAVDDLIDLKSNLTDFKNQFCICSYNVTGAVNETKSLMEKMNKTETLVMVMEKQLIKQANICINDSISTLTLLNITDEYSHLKKILDSIQPLLMSLLTANFVNHTTWKNLTNCSDFITRVDFAKEKYYQFSLAADNTRQSKIFDTLSPAEISSMSFHLEDCKENQKNALSQLINSIKNLTIIHQLFFWKLADSATEVAQILSDLNVLRHKFCGCTTDARYTTDKPPTTKKMTAPVPGPYQCAVWARYNGDEAPATNGFSAGISYLANTEAYVGFIHFVEKSGLPIRIQITETTINGTVKPPGGYIHNTRGGDFYDQVEYLVVPEGCKCSWMNPAVAIPRHGLVTNGVSNPSYGFGRKTFSNRKVQITRIGVDQKDSKYFMKQFYTSEDTNNDTIDTPNELLVCETSDFPNEQPKINFSTSMVACGVWSSFNMINTVTTNGFSAGYDFNTNYKVWIGRGENNFLYSPGRYQNEAPTGTYITIKNGTAFGERSQWLIVPKGCQCDWINLSEAKARRGLVETTDFTNNYKIGRVLFTYKYFNFTAISRVEFDKFGNQCYKTTGKMICDYFTDKVLVCETSKL